MPGFDHQAQIRRQGPIVCCPRCFIVLVGGRDVVGKLPRAFFDLALVIRFGVVFVLLGHGFHFVDGVGGADERTPRDAIQRVAGGADFAIDLEAAAEARQCILA